MSEAKPLYQVVADRIVQRLAAGDWPANSRIPSEAELCVMFGVGRNTVRHALSQLAEAGILKTLQGVGTFVTEGRTAKTAQYLYGFSQEMKLAGKQTSSEVMESRVVEADAGLARRLEVQLGAAVVYLCRLRIVDDEPTAIERAYLPHGLFPGLLSRDFANLSLYETLSRDYNSQPERAEQEIEAALATPIVGKLLALDPPGVVLVIHRVTRRADGAVIEYVESELRADRFRFFTELKLRSGLAPMVFQRLPVNAAHEKY